MESNTMLELQSPKEIIMYLSQEGVSFRLGEDSRLKVIGTLTPEIREVIRSNKHQIKTFISDSYQEFEDYLTSHLTDTYVFDTEVFQNFFSFAAINVEDKSDRHIFEISERKNERDKLLLFLNRDITLSGFNSSRYDDLILKGVMYLRNIYNLSQSIIKENKIDYDLLYKPVRFRSIDLQKIGGFYFSLKTCAIRLNFENVEDLPFNPDKPVELGQIDTLLQYNLNDTLVTWDLYHYLLPAIQFRKDYEKKYRLDLMVSDSQLGESILKNHYKFKTGLGENDFKYMGTPRSTLEIRDFLSPIGFISEDLTDIFEEIRDWKLTYHTKFKRSKKINFAGINLNLGVGGLHSKDTGGIFETSPEKQLIFIDVSSYYPNLIRNKESYPSHLRQDIISEIYSNLIEQRLTLKSEGDKQGSNLLKLALNSIYGQSNYKYSWLYDPQVFVTVTLNGQFLLLSLIDTLSHNGIKILTVNTDGLIVYPEEDKINLCYKLCTNWEIVNKLRLDYVNLDRYIRKDCNNFMLVKNGEIVKKTGIFQDTYDNIKRDSSNQIIKKSIVSYFFEDISVEDTIRGSQNIFDFVLAKNINRKFKLLYGDKILSRHSRFIASPIGYPLCKFEIAKPDRKIAMWKDWKVLEVNQINGNFSDYLIDYDFYISEAYKIIDKIDR